MSKAKLTAKTITDTRHRLDGPEGSCTDECVATHPDHADTRGDEDDGLSGPQRNQDEMTRRQLAGDARGRAALEHMKTAREALYAACRDLCSVSGAVPHYRELGKLARAVDDIEHEMNLDYVRATHPYKLTHSATDEEIAHGHGCILEPL